MGKCIAVNKFGGLQKRLTSPDQIKRGLEMGTQDIERITIHEIDMKGLLKLFPGRDHQWLCDHFKVNISVCGGDLGSLIAKPGHPKVEFWPLDREAIF